MRPHGYSLGQRFDLAVWQKSSDDKRAVIEIKRAWSIADLRGDWEKVATFLKRNDFQDREVLEIFGHALHREDRLGKGLLLYNLGAVL